MFAKALIKCKHFNSLRRKDRVSIFRALRLMINTQLRINKCRMTTAMMCSIDDHEYPAEIRKWERFTNFKHENRISFRD